jgi:hypothetical protein
MPYNATPPSTLPAGRLDALLLEGHHVAVFRRAGVIVRCYLVGSQESIPTATVEAYLIRGLIGDVARAVRFGITQKGRRLLAPCPTCVTAAATTAAAPAATDTPPADPTLLDAAALDARLLQGRTLSIREARGEVVACDVVFANERVPPELFDQYLAAGIIQDSARGQQFKLSADGRRKLTSRPV